MKAWVDEYKKLDVWMNWKLICEIDNWEMIRYFFGKCFKVYISKSILNSL